MKTLSVGPLLGGRELQDAGGGEAEVVNPATGQVIARQTCCDAAAVGGIVESSRQAFESRAWQATTPAARACASKTSAWPSSRSLVR